MIGKFIGNSSMGFKSGYVYNIKTEIKNVRKGGLFGKSVPCICVYDVDSMAWCPYESLGAVLKNWEFYSTKNQ